MLNSTQCFVQSVSLAEQNWAKFGPTCCSHQQLSERQKFTIETFAIPHQVSDLLLQYTCSTMVLHNTVLIVSSGVESLKLLQNMMVPIVFCTGMQWYAEGPDRVAITILTMHHLPPLAASAQ